MLLNKTCFSYLGTLLSLGGRNWQLIYPNCFCRLYKYAAKFIFKNLYILDHVKKMAPIVLEHLSIQGTGPYSLHRLQELFCQRAVQMKWRHRLYQSKKQLKNIAVA